MYVILTCLTGHLSAVNPLLSGVGGGAYLFETHWRVGAGFTCIEEGGVLGRGWLIQFSKGNGISSHKDLCRMQSGKAQLQEIGGHAAKDKK